MSLANIALNQISIMFLIILIGVICYKLKLIDKEANKTFSNILLMLVNPLLIFVSYQRDFSSELLNGLLISFVLALVTHIFGIVVAHFLLKGNKDQDIPIERFSVIYSNCGFIGIPLINGMFGSEGVFYITAYITIFNILIWTHGIIMMIGRQDRRTMTRTLISPTMIAVLLGFIFFIAQIRIPNNLFQSFNYVASMNTPFAMIIAGVTIGQSNIRKLFGKTRIYLVSFIKLLLIPAVLLLLYSRFQVKEAVLTTAILAAACPTAATGTLFAIRYDKNALYASEIFAVTTIFSLVTIPLIMLLAEYIR